MARKHRGHFARALKAGARRLAQPAPWGALVVGLLVLTLLVCSILYLPGYIAARDLRSSGQVGASVFGPSLEPPKTTELLTAQNNIRTALLQGLGGLFFVVTAFFTWRQVRLKSDEQITDRFNAAIDHLGNDKNMDIRLGGIQALARIAKDSKRDREAIIDILINYIQRCSPRKSPEPKGSHDHDQNNKATAERRQSAFASRFDSLKMRAPDVQAALSALGRDFLDTKNIDGIELRFVDYRLAKLTGADFLGGAILGGADLSHADLSRANLAEANLAEACLTGAILTGAILTGAILAIADLSHADLRGANLAIAFRRNRFSLITNLTGAHLEGAHLEGALLTGALLLGTHLEGAYLTGAILTGAILEGAHLEGAGLLGAHLSGANLSGANLEGALLEGAHLEGAHLKGADLSGTNVADAILIGAMAVAKGEHATTWPVGFSREDARARGVILVDESETERPAINDSQPAQPH